jgi:putative zinc finger protein
MNNCMDTEIQEMLPDLLHRTLAADARARVEAHVASCEQCREELEVLRTVKSAAVFAPAINVDQVVRQIPPYQKIVPVVERPATTRVVSWLVAATMAIAVIGGGSLVLARRDVPNDQRAVVIKDPPVSNPSPAAPEPTSTSTSGSQSEPNLPTVEPHTHALALAADVGGLSDGNLEQLMTEMAQFDALPATEADPVISVDTSYNLDQDSE